MGIIEDMQIRISALESDFANIAKIRERLKKLEQQAPPAIGEISARIDSVAEAHSWLCQRVTKLEAAQADSAQGLDNAFGRINRLEILWAKPDVRPGPVMPAEPSEEQVQRAVTTRQCIVTDPILWADSARAWYAAWRKTLEDDLNWWRKVLYDTNNPE